MKKMTHAYMRRQKNLVLVYAWACIHVLNESAQVDWSIMDRRVQLYLQLCVHSCTRVRLVQQFGAVYVCTLISCGEHVISEGYVCEKMCGTRE